MFTCNQTRSNATRTESRFSGYNPFTGNQLSNLVGKHYSSSVHPCGGLDVQSERGRCQTCQWSHEQRVDKLNAPFAILSPYPPILIAWTSFPPLRFSSPFFLSARVCSVFGCRRWASGYDGASLPWNSRLHIERYKGSPVALFLLV